MGANIKLMKIAKIKGINIASKVFKIMTTTGKHRIINRILIHLNSIRAL